MPVNQIYTLVNSVVGQSLGSDAITAVDAQSLVALGNAVLSSSTTTEHFLNTLVQRIGRTIISTRAYRSQFADLVLTDMEWGNILQKIKIKMPVAEADESFNLTNGGTVDHYKISKPAVTQKLFVKNSPYQLHITIQRVHLKEAFTSETAMGAFIQGVFTEVQNKIELSLENLGRTCLNNMIAETVGTARAINLLDLYNTETNASLTVGTAKHDEGFLRFAIATIKKYSKRMEAMSTLYNDGSETRHTPLEMQKLYVLTDWETRFETNVQYAAFNEQYVKLNGFKELAYLQDAQDASTCSIKVKRASDGATKTLDNIVGCLFDRDALGIFKKEEWTSTTPFNSAGGYANTYWHLQNSYLNDTSENFLVFYLAEA